MDRPHIIARSTYDTRAVGGKNSLVVLGHAALTPVIVRESHIAKAYSNRIFFGSFIQLQIIKNGQIENANSSSVIHEQPID